MKKLFLSMLAAVTLFASCSQEEIVTKTDGESLVSFTVTTPELGSRAVGDGTTAKNLYYAVYDETSGQSVMVENISKNGTEGVTNDVLTMPESKKTTINLPLLNGHKYSLLFWAENAEGAYKIDFATKSISLNNAATLVSNNEKYDAFYAYVEPFVVTGEKNESVLLYRPFAQLNIGTTQDDIDRVGEYFGSELTATQIVVKKVPTSMDLATGKVSDTTTDLTYSETEFSVIEGETFPVVGGYQYISMNYILVGKAEKSLVDVVLTTDVANLEARNYDNIPLQANYRTNIFGELFTSKTKWDVEIDSEFEDAYTNLSGVVELENDMVIEKTLLVTGDAVLNLNGKKIINKLDNATTDVIVVSAGSSLTINGEGTIEAVTGNDGFTIISEGTLTINGGTYKSGVDANGDPNAVIYARGNGKVYVNGGNFPNDNKSKFVLNKKDADRATTTIEVRGGTFGCFDPANNAAENPRENFLADGYSSIQVGDNYVVVEGTPEILNDEFVVDGVTTLKANAVTSVKAEMKAGSTLDGGNNTLFIGGEDLSAYFVPAGTSGTLRFIETAGNATIKNITVDGNNAEHNGYGIRGIFLTGEGTVTIDNVTIKNVTYTINDDAKAKTLKVSNSILEGWTSYNPQTTATFEGCTFMAGPNTNGFAPHGETVVKDCTFNKDFKIYLDRMTKAGKTIKFVNCTYDGTLITEATVGNIITDAGTGVIVW